MRVSLPDFLIPPKLPSYEQTQKARLIHAMLIAIFLGALGSGIADFTKGWIIETLLLFLLSGACLVGYYFYHAQHYDLAGFILCATMFFVIGFLLFNGIGLYDATIITYPIFILCSAFIFRRWGLVVATVLAVLSVVFIYLLQVYGIFSTLYPASLFRVVILSFLFVTAAMVIWVVRETWISHLSQLRLSEEALRESEEKFRRLFETSRDFLYNLWC
jgi:hypothetical protein